MDTRADHSPAAWRPLTPRGVAAFARASLGRLFLVQSIVALLMAGVTVWVLSACWFPTVALGIEHLPARGSIRSGRLNWFGDEPQSLAESRFLAFAVDLTHSGQARSPSQIQVELGKNDVRIYSVFGCAQLPYPPSLNVALNQHELKPWWGAWAPFILTSAALIVVIGLLISWAILTTVYCLPACLVALYLNRDLSLSGGWRLAGAALMPGALVMTVAVAGYGMAQLDLVRLAAAWVFHLLLGLVYLLLGTAATPKIQTELSARKNPFQTGAEAEVLNSETALKKAEQNPFSPRHD